MAMQQSSAATTSSQFIKCVGYFLTIKNGVNGLNFDIKVNGLVHVPGSVDQIDEYNLQANSPADPNTALVKILIQKLGELWPRNDFEFQADEANLIIKIKS